MHLFCVYTAAQENLFKATSCGSQSGGVDLNFEHVWLYILQWEDYSTL